MHRPDKGQHCGQNANAGNDKVDTALLNKLILFHILFFLQVEHEPNDKLRQPNHRTANSDVDGAKHISLLGFVVGVVHDLVVFEAVVYCAQEQAHRCAENEVDL